MKLLHQLTNEDYLKIVSTLAYIAHERPYLEENASTVNMAATNVARSMQSHAQHALELIEYKRHYAEKDEDSHAN